MHDVPACIEVYNIAVIILTLLLAALIQSWLLNLFNLSPQVFDQERDYLQLGLQAIDQTWTQRLDHASSGKDGHGHWHSRLHGAFAAGWWQAEIASGCIHKDQMKLRLCIIYCTEWIYNLLLDTPWYTSTQMFMLDLFCCTHTYEIVYITSSTKKLLYPFYLMYLIDGMISPLANHLDLLPHGSMDPLRTPMPWRMVSRCVEVPLRLESPSSLISRRCLGSWSSWFLAGPCFWVLGGCEWNFEMFFYLGGDSWGWSSIVVAKYVFFQSPGALFKTKSGHAHRVEFDIYFEIR